MKIVLVAVNAKYIHSNLAVYNLRAYAQKNIAAQEKSLHIEIAEYTINQREEEILRDLYSKKADVIAVSCYIWNISMVNGILEDLSVVCPQISLWVGGPEVSFNAAELLQKNPFITGVMRGEGEEIFRNVTEYYLRRDRSLDEIPGITYRDEKGQIRENAPEQLIDLSEVPFVYRDVREFAHKILYYESSRGCPFSCSYCLSSVDKALRFRRLDLVESELALFLKWKVPQVKFVDRTFNCKKEHSRAIWRYLLEHDNGITNFHFEIGADLLEEEDLELLRSMRPGQVQLEIGVQSTNERTLSAIRRSAPFSAIARNVARIHEGGNIHQHLDLIAGLPYEDFESFGRSFDQVYALAPSQLQLGFLKVLKGSDMGRTKSAYGLCARRRAPYEVLCTNWLSYQQICRLKNVEMLVEWYYNSGQFCFTMRELAKTYESAFAMFLQMAAYYGERHWFMAERKREIRYEQLLAFVEDRDRYRALLTYDYYLRENAKNRPAFAGESMVSTKWARSFYQSEAKELTFLGKSYAGYDSRQLARSTHLECVSGEGLLLFDYQNRNPIDGNARVIQLVGEDGVEEAMCLAKQGETV